MVTSPPIRAGIEMRGHEPRLQRLQNWSFGKVKAQFTKCNSIAEHKEIKGSTCRNKMDGGASACTGSKNPVGP